MNRILMLRTKLQLSQKEFGDKIGVSQQAIHKYETGEAKPSTSTLMKIAKAFGISIDSLIKADQTENIAQNCMLYYLTREEFEMIKYLRSIDQDNRQYIKQLLKVTCNKNKGKINNKLS